MHAVAACSSLTVHTNFRLMEHGAGSVRALLATALPMSEQDFTNLCEERALARKCGSPLCGNPAPRERRASLRAATLLAQPAADGGAREQEVGDWWCSSECRAKCVKLAVSLGSAVHRLDVLRRLQAPPPAAAGHAAGVQTTAGRASAAGASSGAAGAGANSDAPSSASAVSTASAAPQAPLRAGDLNATSAPAVVSHGQQRQAGQQAEDWGKSTLLASVTERQPQRTAGSAIATPAAPSGSAGAAAMRADAASNTGAGRSADSSCAGPVAASPGTNAPAARVRKADLRAISNAIHSSAPLLPDTRQYAQSVQADFGLVPTNSAAKAPTRLVHTADSAAAQPASTPQDSAGFDSDICSDDYFSDSDGESARSDNEVPAHLDPDSAAFDARCVSSSAAASAPCSGGAVAPDTRAAAGQTATLPQSDGAAAPSQQRQSCNVKGRFKPQPSRRSKGNSSAAAGTSTDANVATPHRDESAAPPKRRVTFGTCSVHGFDPTNAPQCREAAATAAEPTNCSAAAALGESAALERASVASATQQGSNANAGSARHAGGDESDAESDTDSTPVLVLDVDQSTRTAAPQDAEQDGRAPDAAVSLEGASAGLRVASARELQLSAADVERLRAKVANAAPVRLIALQASSCSLEFASLYKHASDAHQLPPHSPRSAHCRKCTGSAHQPLCQLRSAENA